MHGEQRKAAIAAYRERKNVAGIYLVRCEATGALWVGQTPTLDTVQNRIWFTLRLGNNPNPTLQKAWSDHGPDSFAFEVVEQLPDEETSTYVRNAALKERLAHWQATLDAAPLL
ncbi:MAG TPA: GIY-YIG nuclease family protein [Hyphomicrobiaceae bacterium]|nr:GIY-YIG nuclease family protein [Hyphomicrobiaceae bacterium]